ncbi:MAG TPA: DUF397 domain-containing protein [Actinokineospora sp.]|jgi:hypothetical protein|nr:DUF397 domain-containing protein [Actinokineospora sp.]
MTLGKWRKSSFSTGGEQSDCLEVRFNPDLTRLRDSKNAAGPILTVPPAAWATLLDHVAR